MKFGINAFLFASPFTNRRTRPAETLRDIRHAGAVAIESFTQDVSLAFLKRILKSKR